METKMAEEMDYKDSKMLNVGLVIVATLVIAKLFSALLIPRSNKRLPPTVQTWPLLGGLIRFMKKRPHRDALGRVSQPGDCVAGFPSNIDPHCFNLQYTSTKASTDSSSIHVDTWKCRHGSFTEVVEDSNPAITSAASKAIDELKKQGCFMDFQFVKNVHDMMVNMMYNLPSASDMMSAML